MKTLLTCLLSISIMQAVFGQVFGKLTEAGGQPVPFATVSLFRSVDSILLQSVSTDNNGAFKIVYSSNGKYFIQISMVGYKPWISSAFELSASTTQKNFGTIIISAVNNQLGEVVIRADKPLVKQEAGGLVVNVQNSLLTRGSSVLEVLARSPGVIVNPSDNSITLNGKSGVMVMLDGKLMRMSTSQVAALLNGMGADDVEKIELLNTPPSKYDADGNAGLINIVTKKNKKPGTNGSVTATAGYGKGEKGSASIHINHNIGQISIYGSYSYWHDRSQAELLANGTENVPVIGGHTTFDYTGVGKPVSNYHDAVAGTDVQLNSKMSIGASINYSIGYVANTSHNYGVYALRPDSVLLFNSYLTGVSRTLNLINSVYLDQQLSKNENIRLDADYIDYQNNSPNEVQSTFVDNHGNQAGAADSTYAPRQRDLANTNIQVSIAKIDYANQINTRLKLEAGAKGTYTNSSSVSGIENLVHNNWVSSLGTSNNLDTRETIGAAYATLHAQPDTATNLVIGGRYEYSHNSTENAVSSLYDVERRLGKLFPGIFFTRKLDSASQLQLSYTERISRPSYRDLASYISYNDPVSVFTGNPELKPTITHNFKFGYNIHNYLFSLLLSKDDNPILQTQIMTGPTKGLVYLTPENADWQKYASLQATIPVNIAAWWDMNYSFNGGLRQYKIDYTPIPLEKTYFSYSVDFTENFKLPGALAAEISGYYNSSSYSGNSRSNGNIIVNMGIKKTLHHNKGSFQLSVADLLRTAVYSSYVGGLTTDAFDTRVHVAYNGESRSVPIVKLTYYRSLGSGTVKRKRKDDNGSREEQGRIGN